MGADTRTRGATVLPPAAAVRAAIKRAGPLPERTRPRSLLTAAAGAPSPEGCARPAALRRFGEPRATTQRSPRDRAPARRPSPRARNLPPPLLLTSWRLAAPQDSEQARTAAATPPDARRGGRDGAPNSP
ncbi:hypothetical protein NDU88_002616 [Pleurodeles waltl]|uniref:Uncharacterized protein n=1 Tax=Pleurodeles waltl TaxID=8319 RepID=A0AAV7LPR8_PLEWA|nr:hypothetical protein NDU88_002616 [Pleurodeles waltl]